jgi:hypothetical protein
MVEPFFIRFTGYFTQYTTLKKRKFMAVMRRWILGILAGLLPFLGMAQNIEDRSVGDYDQIRIFGKLSVEMVPGVQNKIHIESRNVRLDKIETKVEEGELKIKMTSSLLKSERPDVLLRVTYNDLKGITTLGDAEVRFDKPVVQDVFAIKATSGSYIRLSIDAQELDLQAYQGGQVHIDGQADSLVALVNTGGILSGTGLVCQKVNIKLNTGGNGELTVQKELEANVNTGSDFSYFGHPEATDIQTAFGGSVSAWDKE